MEVLPEALEKVGKPSSGLIDQKGLGKPRVLGDDADTRERSAGGKGTGGTAKGGKGAHKKFEGNCNNSGKPAIGWRLAVVVHSCLWRVPSQVQAREKGKMLLR